MTIKVIGIERKDYNFDGIEFHGNYIHCAKINEPKQGLEGDVVTTIKIPDNHKCANLGMFVGKKYTVYFDDKKKIDFIGEFNS